jgi:hypothetical protein
VAPTPAPSYTPTPRADLPFVHGYPVADWLNREYRKAKTVRAVRKQFVEDSSIELHNFLRKDVYDALTTALAEEAEERWLRVGPRNHCSYATHTEEKQTASEEKKSLLTQVRAFFQSAEFGCFLTEITGVGLASGSCELRRFSAGDYTLAYDLHPEWKRAGLDVTLCCLPVDAGRQWTTAHGGTIHYIAKGEEEELLSVYPRVNVLSVVYRNDPGALPFVKYVNNRAPCPRYDVSCIMRFDAMDEDEDEDEEEDEPDTQKDVKKQN